MPADKEHWAKILKSYVEEFEVTHDVGDDGYELVELVSWAINDKKIPFPRDKVAAFWTKEFGSVMRRASSHVEGHGAIRDYLSAKVQLDLPNGSKQTADKWISRKNARPSFWLMFLDNQHRNATEAAFAGQRHLDYFNEAVRPESMPQAVFDWNFNQGD